MTYRIDIQLLRAVAVVYVVLYHLKVPFFDAGFLGVDVFFVVSGYLMARLCRPGHSMDFYRRRAQRLLPAYFATIAAVVVVSTLVAKPAEHVQVLDQALYSIMLLPNMWFWSASEYFNAIQFSPLLHLWSLGVELQFYLFVPLLMVVVRWSRLGLWALLIGSLLLCFGMLSISHTTAFYTMPLRAWQFLIGVAAAIYQPTPYSNEHTRRSIVGVLAFIAVLAIPMLPVVPRSPSVLTGHPGLIALAISVATALVLMAGLPDRLTTHSLSRPIRGIGDASYAIYLVHFPIIVWLNYVPFGPTVLGLSMVTAITMFCLLLVLAGYVVHRFVERPFRRSVSLRALLVTALATLALIPASHAVNRSLVSADELVLYDALLDRDRSVRCGRWHAITSLAEPLCSIGSSGGDADPVFLIGDSHADSLKRAFAKQADEQEYQVWFADKNRPLSGGMSHRQLSEQVQARRPRAIILHYSSNEDLVGITRGVVDHVSRGEVPVLVYLPVPRYQASIPAWLYAHRVHGAESPTMDAAEYRRRNDEIAAQLSALHAKNLFIYDPARYLCESECRVTDDGGRPLYFDGAHLTHSGAGLLQPMFAQSLNDLDRSKRH